MTQKQHQIIEEWEDIQWGDVVLWVQMNNQGEIRWNYGPTYKRQDWSSWILTSSLDSEFLAKLTPKKTHQIDTSIRFKDLI